MWKSLKDDPPLFDGSVLLFPQTKNVDKHIYIISNTCYARANAYNEGYTHWSSFESHPEEFNILESLIK